jgi:hypothetical protein
VELTVVCNHDFAHRGKVLALELIKILLENSGLKFRKTDMYISAMRS